MRTAYVEAEKWADEKLRLGDWKDKTGKMFLAAIRLFCKFAGDRDISEYKKDDAREFKRILLQYPVNVWKYPEFDGLSPEQVIKAGKPPMSPNSARKIFAFVSSFFREAATSYDSLGGKWKVRPWSIA